MKTVAIQAISTWSRKSGTASLFEMGKIQASIIGYGRLLRSFPQLRDGELADLYHHPLNSAMLLFAPVEHFKTKIEYHAGAR